MQRRDFLRFTVLMPLAAMSLRVTAGTTGSGTLIERMPDGHPHRFELSAQDFLLDGKPFQIRSGEMHPIRIPAEYWRHRIRMAKAMGLNTISICLMWNAMESEPGVFDLKTGSRDFVRFIRLCQEEGMWLYLRPGPYVCAEWDFGGLPPYLLRDPGIKVRDRHDAHYMRAVGRYFDEIAPHIAPLMAARGGPVLMVQIENEYASFGDDLAYLEQLRSMWRERGVDGPFAISDGLGQIRKMHTYLPGAVLGLDGDTDFAGAQAIAGQRPVWMSEGYPGWLTHWGDKKFASGDFDKTLRKLLAEDRSFNLYMAHGGSNFGFGAGANASNDDTHFEPVITSYDYGAPINERGEATADYHRMRSLIAAHAEKPLPKVPMAPPVMRFPALTLQPHASLWDNLPPTRQVDQPQANELLFGQDHGMVLYRKRLRGGGRLSLDGLRDYATVFRDNRYLGALSRMQHSALPKGLALDLPPSKDETVLDILVDSFGHVGYGQAMSDRKGIVDAIHLDGKELRQWEVHSLPLDDAWVAGLRPLHSKPTRPGVFFKGDLVLDETGDTYIDMSSWDKGYVWVNRRLLGRYWKIGPQQRLYCPASWLREGHNEILVLDMHRTEAATIRGVETLQAQHPAA